MKTGHVNTVTTMLKQETREQYGLALTAAHLKAANQN
jgi:hypothetical protein